MRERHWQPMNLHSYHLIENGATIASVWRNPRLPRDRWWIGRTCRGLTERFEVAGLAMLAAEDML